jgi:hypothetical protein
MREMHLARGWRCAFRPSRQGSEEGSMARRHAGYAMCRRQDQMDVTASLQRLPAARLVASAVLCRMSHCASGGSRSRSTWEMRPSDWWCRDVKQRTNTRAWEQSQTRPSYSTGTQDGTRSRMPDVDAIVCVHGSAAKSHTSSRDGTKCVCCRCYCRCQSLIVSLLEALANRPSQSHWAATDWLGGPFGIVYSVSEGTDLPLRATP